MSMTVKAYLEGADGQPEIRRFAVDQGVSASYTYLASKIPQVFPTLAGKQFDLYWKDNTSENKEDLKPLKSMKRRKRKADNNIEDKLQNIKISKPESLNDQDVEGDSIAFSSDDELTEALGFVNDGLFKVYIRPSTRTAESSGSSGTGGGQGECHPGVVCDSCEGRIFGSRFKCCVCPDFDLCGVCEGRGKHEEHPMFRIRTPANPFENFGFMNQPHGPPPPPYGPHGHHGPHGPHGPHHPPPPPGHAGPFGPGGMFGGGPHHGGGPGGMFGGGPHTGGPGQFKPWRKMMKRCWRKYWRDMYEQQGEKADKGADSDSDTDTKDPKEPRKESEHTQKGAPGECSGDKEADGDSPTEEYLKDVGESVAAMLDPLGIDVAVDVECHGKRKKCHGGGGGGGGRGGWGGWGGRGWGGGRGGCGRRGRWMGMGGGPSPWMFAGMGPGMFGMGGLGADGGAWAGAWSQQDQSSRAQSGAPEQKPSPGDMEPPVERSGDQDMQQENGSGANAEASVAASVGSPFDVQMGSPSQHSEHSDGDWIVMQDKAENVQTDVQTDGTTGATKPNRPQSQAPLHPIPQMAQALDQLRSMGFNDDGGWLTQLLEAKNGDINKTLDALKPHRPDMA